MKVVGFVGTGIKTKLLLNINDQVQINVFSVIWPREKYVYVFIYANMYAYAFMYIYVWIYPTPPPWAGSDDRSIFKWSTPGLNLESSFF